MRRILIPAVVVLVVLSACGSDPDDSVAPETVVAAAAGPVTVPAEPYDENAVDIHRPADEVPEPIGDRGPEAVDIDVRIEELNGVVAEGTSYTYWTFDSAVPGPLMRVREGDTVNLSLNNPGSSAVAHNIDLHAVNGPGGGAVGTNVAPGETKDFTFQALNPGLYVYHCATQPIPAHISNGMYGLILVEPEGGLPPVDKEFYVAQGELYTAQPTGTQGHLTTDTEAMADEHPTYVTFNGAFQALTGDNALKAEVGDRVRLFVGNGGPNLISSFHVIGEIFDEVHPEGSSEAATNVQTTLIPAGGGAWVEFTVDVPGTYVLVDHSLSRAVDKGVLGHLVVTGDANPEIFDAPFAEEDASH